MGKSSKKCAFGNVKDITAIYGIDRGNETHTKIIDIPSPFNGKLTVDDALEPSEYLLLEFRGTHGSRYIGINYVCFYDENDEEIGYTNVAVDGREVDGSEVPPAMPTAGWWTAEGEEHSLLFRFGSEKQRVKQIGLYCENASATPKYVHVTDGRTPANSSDSSNDSSDNSSSNEPQSQFHKDCVFQLAGDGGKNPTELRFRPSPRSKEKIPFTDLISTLNKDAPPPNGFSSFFSTCEKYVFVLYRRGLRTRAYNYYFGSSPSPALALASSVSGSGNGTVNERPEERAVSLAELRAIRAVVLSHCVRDRWRSAGDGAPLRPEDVTLYDLNAELVRPLTKKRSCSFKELFASGPREGVFYTGHWWGEGVLDFVRCCEVHAGVHGLGEDSATYWVCAYAHRQHNLGEDLEIGSGRGPFRRAMEIAKGAVLIIDPECVVYSRIWVDFEMLKAIESGHTSVDMVTHHEGNVHLLAANSVGEEPYQRNRRELRFPYSHVCRLGLHVQLENGVATKEIDKVRILNAIANNKNTDCKKALRRLADPNRDGTPDAVLYQKSNGALRSALALRCIPAALLTAGQSLEDFHGADLPGIVAADGQRTDLALELGAIDAVTDAVFRRLVGLVTSNIRELDVGVVGCQSLTDDCLHSMELPDSLVGMRMRLGMCKGFTNEGVIAAVTNLPQKLTSLTLDVRAYKNSDGSFSPSRRNDHLQTIGTHLPPGLLEFNLSTTLDPSEDQSGLDQLVRALPRGLHKLSLDIASWEGFRGSSMTSTAANLPLSLKSLELRFRGGNYWEAEEVERFATEIMKLEDLVEFSVRCTDSGASGFYREREFKSVGELSQVGTL